MGRKRNGSFRHLPLESGLAAHDPIADIGPWQSAPQFPDVQDELFSPLKRSYGDGHERALSSGMTMRYAKGCSSSEKCWQTLIGNCHDREPAT